MTNEEMRQREFHKLIKQPFNDAWKVLKIVMEDNSDEAWEKYVAEIELFHDKLSKAQTPKEFAFLKSLYSVVDYGGELIGEIHRVNSGSEEGGRKNG